MTAKAEYMLRKAMDGMVSDTGAVICTPPSRTRPGKRIDNRSMVSQDNPWHKVSDRDPMAVALFERHYSARRYADGRRNRRRTGFVGPGEKCVLVTTDGTALFAWRHALIVDPGNPEGVCCTVFRNEGPLLSSELVLWAEEYAATLWPGVSLYTWVWDAKVKSVNPGYCFKKAGWKRAGRNKDGRLTLLVKTNDRTQAEKRSE